MIDYIKDIINFLSGPTISFSLLTLMSPFLFPPTDWFEKYHFTKVMVYQSVNTLYFSKNDLIITLLEEIQSRYYFTIHKNKREESMGN